MKTCFEFVTDEGNLWQRIVDGYVPVFSGMCVNINSNELIFEIDYVEFDMKNQIIHACADSYDACFINKHRQTLLNEGWTEISPQ